MIFRFKKKKKKTRTFILAKFFHQKKEKESQLLSLRLLEIVLAHNLLFEVHIQEFVIFFHLMLSVFYYLEVRCSTVFVLSRTVMLHCAMCNTLITKHMAQNLLMQEQAIRQHPSRHLSNPLAIQCKYFELTEVVRSKDCPWTHV